ncbi:MAG: double zinc ribbon domain-containing protein [Oscillospiraceae bacterium]|nr:double zinc ribbon domain-containing protein [Oscillospiraceae bacterium]
MGFFSSLLDLLFPPRCVFCGRVLNSGDEGWCSRCMESLPFTNDCGRQSGEFYEFCISPLYYGSSVRKSILRYKFRGVSAYAEIYGKLLADCIKSCPDMKYDIISWVPLSGKRKRSRGYDQAMLLALATALELNDVAAQTLIKPHDVQAQSELGDRSERSANIDGAYEVFDSELIVGKTVLLIDDVVTTGSTLSECAKVLRSAGATNVVCAALARGE